VVHYSNYDDWATPNPQDHPEWWNATAEVTGSQWNQATYHSTSVVGAQASFNFTGSGVWVYGAVGPAASNYTVSVDGAAQAGTATANATEGRTLLYSATNLSGSAHELVLTNQGSGLVLDMVVVEVELGAAGAEITNTTLDDRAPELKFSGEWTQQTGPNFFNQTSTYTSGPGNYFEVNFTGSAVWIYGDQVNDHGEFTVALNGSDVATNNGRSGCGGGFAKYCEKLRGLAFFAGSLPEGEHTLRLTNGGPAEGNKTFFDFDYLVYAQPSAYAAVSDSAAGGNGSTSPTGTAGGSGDNSTAATPNSKNDGFHTSMGTGALAAVLGAWILRKVLA
jgi:hypothetical protein